MRYSRRSGFTLLEVLIVVAIIIIIAGIALPKFLGVSEKGKTARAKGDLRVLQTALESYMLHTNEVPGNDATAGTNMEDTDPTIVTNFAADFVDPFSTANPPGNYAVKTAKNTSTGKMYYIAASVGPNVATTAAITSAGVVTKQADDIVVTNGN